MKKYLKRKIAIMLSLILLISGIDVNVSMSSASVKSPDSSKITTNNLSVKSANSIGELIEDAVSEKENEEDTNNGNNIFSVKMREKTQEKLEAGEEDQEKIFVVDFETVETCKLLLAIYTEDGKEMITSSTVNVCQDETSVEFGLKEIPQYFLIRAFLIDSETNQPFCIKYESPMYTKEMQDFMAKETEDFAKDRVLNLDDSTTNNFAVYDENTQVIDEKGTKNVLREINENEQTYVFDNIDSKISSLQEGDIFSYEQKDNNVLIVKIHTIDIDGNTATITGEDTSMDEVFDYVKIDGTQDLGDAEIEKSEEEGIQYEGLKKNNSDIATRALDFEGNKSLEASVKFIDKKIGGEHVNAKLNGSVKFGMTTSVKVYVSLSYQYLEMKIDYKLSNEISLSGTVKGNIQLLKRVGFSPVPGVFIEFTPSFCVEGNANVSIKTTVKASVGFSVSPQDGFKNLSSSPKYDNTELDGSVNIFVGLSLEPKVVVISESVAEASVTATAGGVIDAKLEMYNSSLSDDEEHECQKCIEGDISAKIVLGVGATFVSKLEIEYSKEFKFKISDFYYSFDLQKWGWGNCPNKKYKIAIVAKNPNGKPVEGAIINNLYKTDGRGTTTIWLNNGTQTITVAKGNGESVSKKITVSGKSKKVIVFFDTNTDAQGNEDSASNPLIGKKIKCVSVNGVNCGIVSTEGDLYTWGSCDDNKQLGTGLSQHKIPKKILSNVSEVQMEEYGLGAALTTNGDLYIWGETGGTNRRDYLDYGEKPTKILENVKSFKIDGEVPNLVCYALTNSDELYLWGIGAGMTELVKDYDYDGKPCMVMGNVKEVDVDGSRMICCVIKNNGELFVWGDEGLYDDNNAILGDLGMDKNGESYSEVPIMKMKDTKSAKLGDGYCVALTNSNDLYAWGENYDGCIGNGTTDDVYEPQKILSDIISYDAEHDSVAAVNNKNQLFVWGSNAYGNLCIDIKDDDYGDKLIPTLLLDNIEEVNLSIYSGCAKTTNGGWYLWGSQAYVGYVGGEEVYRPYKCPLKNVKMLDIYSSTIFAITKKNDLYIWGDGFWETGYWNNWKEETKYEPVKINGDLSSFKIADPNNDYDTYSLKKNNQREYILSDEITIAEPDTVYNVYVVEDDEKNLLAEDNLLYVNQCMSDSEGKFDLEYVIGKEIEGEPYVIVRKLNKINIEECSIEVEDILCSGDSTLVEVNVLYNGKELVEGIDYELTGNVEVKNPGTYILRVEGMGNYTGFVEKSFIVSCPHEYGDWIEMETGRERTCIICGNVQEDLNSATNKPSTTQQSAANNKSTVTKKPSSSTHSNHYSKVSKPGKVTGLKVKNKKKKKMIVSWNWKTSVAGFQIQYAWNKKFTKKKKSKMVGKWTSKKTITKLKKGKTYYVRVRAYKKSSGKKIYGKWSKIKKIKIRK